MEMKTEEINDFPSLLLQTADKMNAIISKQNHQNSNSNGTNGDTLTYV